MPQYPQSWPKPCPPVDAEVASGEIFRLAKSDQLSAEDLRSHEELGLSRKADPCVRCGLSVFRSEVDAVHQHALFPRLGSHLWRGALVEAHGHTKPTPARQPSHTTWWPPAGLDRRSPFTFLRDLRAPEGAA